MSEPTKAAMRAAMAVCPVQTDHRMRSAAKLIDDATGIREMTAALERARHCLEEFRSGYFAREIEAIDAALKIAREGRS